MLEHLLVAGRRAAAFRERVGEQPATDLNSGFVRDLLNQGWAGDVLNEQCAGADGLQVIDQLGEVPCRRLGIGVDPDRGQKCEPIGCLQIPKGVVGGHDRTLAGGQSFELAERAVV